MERIGLRRTQPTPRRAARAAAALLLLLLLPAAARHDRLTHSSPARDETVNVVPSALRLAFSRAIELVGARIALTGPAGPVTLDTLRVDKDSANILVAPVPAFEQAGRYTVEWQIMGADGHPVRGTFDFTIAEGAEGLAPPAPPPAEVQPQVAPEPVPTPTATTFDAESPLYVAIRWLWYTAIIGVIGAAAFRFAVLGRARRAGTEAAVLTRAAHEAARVGFWAAVLAFVATPVRLWAQTQALAGVPVLDLLGSTAWGAGWILQLAASLAALAGFNLAMRGRRGGWILIAPAAVALALSAALSGHAMAAPREPWPIVAHVLHLLGAGGWLGSLLVLASAGLRAARAGSDRWAQAAILVNAFSPLALACATLLVITGTFAGWVHLGSLDAFLGSAYGRTLALKLLVLLGVLGLGAYNFLRIKPSLPDEAATSRLRRSARAELAAAALVLLVTAVLVATPPPAEAPSFAAVPAATGE